MWFKSLYAVVIFLKFAYLLRGCERHHFNCCFCFLAHFFLSCLFCLVKILCITLLRIWHCYFVEVVLYLSKLCVLCVHLVVLAKLLDCSFSVQGCNWL